MSKYFGFIVWFVIFLVITGLSFTLLNKADTASNLLGVLILAVFIILSVASECLTDVKFNHKKCRNKNG